MIKNIHSYIIVASAVFILSACGNTNKQDDLETDSIDTNTEAVVDSQKISAQNVFNAIPGRTEIINITQEARAEYNAEVLNNPDDVNKYSLESSKALNLGVYGSDLNVTGVFEQSQESMLFFKCVNILSKSLGISNCFDERMADRMEANKENRDSTLEIISQSFRNADKFLKANGRPGTSSLIVAGAWIEGMHTACHTAEETKSEAVVKEIFDQKESLKYLIELLEVSKLSEEVKYLIADLKGIQAIVEAKNDNVYTLAAMGDLSKKITELRTKVISSK
jgi:hypothetical protein